MDLLKVLLILFFSVSSSAQQLTLADVEALISRSNGMNDFISKLPASYRERFIPMGSTRSPQYASVKSPRMIGLSDPRATRFLFGFPGQPGPGEPQTRKSSVVEMIDLFPEEFDPQSPAAFYAVDFNEDQPKLARILRSDPLQIKNAQGHVIQNCYSCHKNGLPIWEEADFWLGAMEGVTGFNVTDRRDFYHEFWNARKNDPFYGLFVEKKGPFHQRFRKDYAGFNKLINEVSMNHFAKVLVRHPKYEELRTPLLMGLLNSDEVLKYLPGSSPEELEALKEKIFNHNYFDYRDEIQIKHANALGVRGFRPVGIMIWEMQVRGIISRVEYTFQKLAPELTIDRYSSSLGENHVFGFINDVVGAEEPRTRAPEFTQRGFHSLLYFLTDADPVLQAFVKEAYSPYAVKQAEYFMRNASTDFDTPDRWVKWLSSRRCNEILGGHP